eukprot:Gb_32005 [translate_table: standard]
MTITLMFSSPSQCDIVQNGDIIPYDSSLPYNHTCCMIKENPLANPGTRMNVYSKNLRDPVLYSKSKRNPASIP